MELTFIYDNKVDLKLTPEYQKESKEKGIRRNIKKNMEKDKNYNEIMDGLNVKSVKFNKAKLYEKMLPSIALVVVLLDEN